MKRELQRIEPSSAMRIGFFIGMATGLVVGLLEAFLLKAMSGANGGAGVFPAEAAPLANSSGSTLVLLAIVMGLLFSLIFAFFGALLAVVYNLAARSFGGIELYLSGDEERERQRSNREWDSTPEDDDHE